MDSRRSVSCRPVGRRVSRSRWRAQWVSLAAPIAVVVIVYGLLPLILDSPLIGIGVIGLLSLVALVSAVGTEQASTVMLVLAFGFAPLTNFAFGPKPLVLASAFFVLAFGLALPRLIHRALRLPAAFLVGAALFVTMGVIAVPLAISPLESAIYIAIATVALVLMPAAVAWMDPSDRQMYAMALAFGIGTAASTLIGLPGYTYRNAGFTYHPVALAYTAMLTLSFVPFLLASKWRGRWVVVPLIAFIALVGVWTSGSRTSLLVLVALTLLIPLLERSIKFGLVVAGGIVLILPSMSAFDLTGNSTSALSRLLGSGGAQGSDTVRRQTLMDGLEQVQASPILGNGYSTEHTYVIHNLYVQVLAAEGVIGLLGILLILGTLVLPLRSAPPPQRYLAYPALAVILAGPFQPNMGDHYLGLTLGLAMVASVGVKRRQSPEGAKDRDAPSLGVTG